MTQGAVAAGEHILLLPLGSLNATRINGREITSEDAVLLSPGSDIFATVRSRLSWGAISLTQQVVEALDIDVPRAGQFHHASGLLGQAPALSVRVAEVLAAGRTRTDIAAGSPAAEALSEDLRQAVGQALARPLAGTGANRATHRHMALVRRTNDYVRHASDRPITMAEICAVLAVPERSLRAAFAAVHGVSPHVYLRMRRLDLVRAALLRTPRAPGRVKQAALSHGFWHLGRFSAEYQARFGESPSRTAPAGAGVATLAAAAAAWQD
jgi:AraC-like DNA-binding protein